MEVAGDNPNSIAVLIDQENVHSSKVCISEMLDRISEQGRIAIKRAYGDWGRFSAVKHELLALGIDLVELPSMPRGKNRADIRLVVDAMELAFTKEHITTYVLVSGDSDFIQLAAKLRELNRRVVFIARQDSASSLLIESCDELIYLPEKNAAAKPKKQAIAKNKTNQTAISKQPINKATKPAAEKATTVASVEGPIEFNDDELNAFAWTLSYLESIATKKHNGSFFLLSQFQHATALIYPDFNIAKFGFPKNGRWVKLIQALEQEGWVEIDFDSLKRLYHLKPTIRLANRILNCSTLPRIEQLLVERRKRAELVHQTTRKPVVKKRTDKSDGHVTSVQAFSLEGAHGLKVGIECASVDPVKERTPVRKKVPKSLRMESKKKSSDSNQLPLPFAD